MVGLPWVPFLAINEFGDHVFVAMATHWVWQIYRHKSEAMKSSSHPVGTPNTTCCGHPHILVQRVVATPTSLKSHGMTLSQECH
jgi:hypothetical protein